MYIPPLSPEELQRGAEDFLKRIYPGRQKLDREYLKYLSEIKALMEEEEAQNLNTGVKEEPTVNKRNSNTFHADTNEELDPKIYELNLKEFQRKLQELTKDSSKDKTLITVLLKAIMEYLPDGQDINDIAVFEAENYFEGVERWDFEELEAYIDGFEAGAKYIIDGLLK